MDAVTVIRQARDAGLRLELAGEGLAVTPSDRLTPELRALLREHKGEILPILRAANDTVPAIDVLLARHGAATGGGGVQWATWIVTRATASSSWLVLTPSGLTLLRTAAPVPRPRSYSQAWPVERKTPWPEDDAPDPSTEQPAADAIRHAARPCWDCVALRTTHTASSKLPRCDHGHALVYRATATRTWPGRADAADCGDRA
jgi:hypothetical protein